MGRGVFGIIGKTGKSNVLRGEPKRGGTGANMTFGFPKTWSGGGWARRGTPWEDGKTSAARRQPEKKMGTVWFQNGR